MASRPVPLERVAGNWGLHVLVGLVAIAAGVLAIAYPDITLLVLGLVFGINLLVYGAFSLAVAFEPEPVHGALRAIVGTVAIITGLICVVRPGASVVALLLVIAIWFIIAGVSDLILGLTIPGARFAHIVLGLIGLAAGVILLSDIELGLSTLALIAGILFIVRGTFDVIAGIEMRQRG